MTDPIPCIVENQREIALALLTDDGMFKVATLRTKWGNDRPNVDSLRPLPYTLIAFGPRIYDALREVCPEQWAQICDQCALEMLQAISPERAKAYKMTEGQKVLAMVADLRSPPYHR